MVANEVIFDVLKWNANFDFWKSSKKVWKCKIFTEDWKTLFGYELISKYFVRENYFLKIKILQLYKMIYSESLKFLEHKSNNELRDI